MLTASAHLDDTSALCTYNARGQWRTYSYLQTQPGRAPPSKARAAALVAYLLRQTRLSWIQRLPSYWLCRSLSDRRSTTRSRGNMKGSIAYLTAEGGGRIALPVVLLSYLEDVTTPRKSFWTRFLILETASAREYPFVKIVFL